MDFELLPHLRRAHFGIDRGSNLRSVDYQFCVAGDGAKDVLTYNGSSWSAPNQIHCRTVDGGRIGNRLALKGRGVRHRR